MADSMNVDKVDVDAAASLMAQGKRHILVHDYTSAVHCIEEACKMFDSIYGVNSDESADAYLKYGSALIELHRQESGALDGLIDAKPSESDAENEEEDEDDEELEDEEEEAKKEDEQKNESNGNKTANEEDISVSPTPLTAETAADNGSITSSTAGPSSRQGSVTSDQNNSNGNTSTTAVAGSTSSLNSSLNTNQMETDVDPNQPSTSTGITDENRAVEDEEEDPSNLEIAFEVVKMAKDIFKRQTEYRDDAHLKLAEAHQKLGEILYEWENYPDALTDLLESLEIRKKHLPEDDRLIAETYYHIGLTYSLNKNVDEANSNYQKAVNVIEQRITRQKKLYSDTEDEEMKEKIKCDIKELEFVLPEMKAKIEDSQDQMKSSTLANATEESEKLEEEMIAEKKKQITAKPITNLTHLVKRKREEPEQTENIKKLKNGSENGSNGTANTSTNNDIEVDKV